MAFVPGYKHDLFLSYAHAEAAWVEAFSKALCDEFQVRAGEQLTVWQDSQNLRVGQRWASEIEEGIRSAAAFLAIVSPSYLRSPWCGQERSIALENGLEALKVEPFYRFLKFIKTPGPGNAHEEMLNELQDIRFFNEADGYELPTGAPEFKAMIRASVRHIREMFTLMSNKDQELYLAHGAIEMNNERAELERELKDRGFTIKPDFVIDFGFGEGPIRQAMDKVSLALFVLGSVHDKFPGTEIKVAQELGRPVVFWVRPGEKQKDMLRRIHELGDPPPGSEVLGGRSIRELIPQLLEKLKPKKPVETTAPALGLARVYLNYDSTLVDDSRIAIRIDDVIRARKFEVVQSGRDGDHERLMRNSNAVLLFRAANPDPDPWLKLNAMELVLAAQIFEKEADFDAKALLVTDPARIQAQARGVPIYSYSEPFLPETLEPFFDGLRRARAADARR